MSNWQDQGLLCGDADKAKSTPAIACYRGNLVVLYRGEDLKLYCCWRPLNGNPSTTPFPDKSVSGTPALIVFNNYLHAVIVGDDKTLVHFRWQPPNQSGSSEGLWSQRQFFGNGAACPDFPASLTEFNGKLYCAYKGTDSNKIRLQHWDANFGWSDIHQLDAWTFVEPCLFVAGGQLRLYYVSADVQKRIYGLGLNSSTGQWLNLVTVQETPNMSISAVGMGQLDSAVMVFQYNIDNRSIGTVEYGSGKWSSNVPMSGNASASLPAITTSLDKLYMVWNNKNDNKIYWSIKKTETKYNLENWMQPLLTSKPDTLLSALNIPGTHESAATSQVPTIACQSIGIVEQLNIGIRAFDIRVGLCGGELVICHNMFSANGLFRTLYFATTMDQIYQWLGSHSTESITIQIKEEGSDVYGTMPPAFLKYLNTTPSTGFQNQKRPGDHWLLTDTIPTLRTCQGKIQLLRRFGPPTNSPLPLGIDVCAWPDNNSDFWIGNPRMINVQDYYSTLTVESKWNAILNFLDKAKSDFDNTHWFINYSSVSSIDCGLSPYAAALIGYDHRTDGGFDFSTAQQFYPSTNEGLMLYFESCKAPCRLGTIMMDYPDGKSRLIPAIIDVNFL